MVKRCLAFLLAVLLPVCAYAAPRWQQETPAQILLKEYMERANGILTETGEEPVNRLFEEYRSFAVLGITRTDDAEIPENVEITVRLFYDAIDSLELRVSERERFPALASALIRALSPETITEEAASGGPSALAQRAADHPDNSYEEEVDPLNGTIPRVYFAYYPNQYHDGTDWLQMTIVFPMQGAWDGVSLISSPTATKAPDTWSDHDASYEGYDSQDDYSHLDVFATATPEPDSAAKEYDRVFRDQ